MQLWERYADVPLRGEYETEFSNQFETPFSSTPVRNNGPAGRRRAHWTRNPQDTRRSNRYITSNFLKAHSVYTLKFLIK